MDLTNRAQMVNFIGFKPIDIRVPSEVPQSSHLDPLLFNLFKNDIQTSFKHSKCLCFADDLKCFSLFVCFSLHRLEEWCQSNWMYRNALVCFSKRRNPIVYDYKIDNVILMKTSSFRNLGITIDSTLSFTPHISDVISRALKMTGFVKRCTRDFTNVSAIRLLYCSLIRPILEYASSVWNPRYACHMHRLEGVQRRFVRYLALNQIIYHLKTVITTILTTKDFLEDRREQTDLKNLFKIFNSHVDCPKLLSLINLSSVNQFP